MITRIFLSLLLITFLTSCATIFKGTKQNVRIESEPAGAKVFIDGTERGVTPLDVKLKRSITGPEILVIKENYKTEKIIPSASLEKVSLLNMLVVPQWGIDLISGAMWKYNPNKYYLLLKQ